MRNGNLNSSLWSPPVAPAIHLTPAHHAEAILIFLLPGASLFVSQCIPSGCHPTHLLFLLPHTVFAVLMELYSSLGLRDGQ